MRLRDLITRVDRSPENSRDACSGDFAEAVGMERHDLEWSNAFSERVKEHPLQTWLCTDTFVGLSAYTMDGETIAISWQPYRGADVAISFVSEAAMHKVRDFLVSLLPRDEPTCSILGEGDLDQEMGDGYTLSFAGAITHDHLRGIYHGEPVELASDIATLRGVDSLRKDVAVRFPDGRVEAIPLAKYVIPYRVVDAGPEHECAADGGHDDAAPVP